MAGTELKKLPVGVSDFECIRRYDSYYADKTQLITKLLDNVHPEGAVLFTRPRRFGKSLALDMLHRFFDSNAKEENRPLFAGLAVSQSERYMAEQGKYPIIHITFKDAKCLTWQVAEVVMRDMLSSIFQSYGYLLESTLLSEDEKRKLKTLRSGDANLAQFRSSLGFLCQVLHRHHGQPVVLLIDEYDVPIQSAYQNGYYDEMIDFMRAFFTAGLKDNPHLRLAVLTGVMRIAKESLFSGLNNLTVDTILQDKYSDCFGFTQDEVTEMAAYYGKLDKLAEIKDWYDGYRFGQRDIYNPWSVLRYFSEDCLPAPYWMDTSSNDLIIEFLRSLQEQQRKQIMALYRGGTVEASVDTAVSYQQLQICRELLSNGEQKQSDDEQGQSGKEQVQIDCANTVFSLMAVSGYLKPVEALGGDDFNLQVPNAEVNTIFAKEILRYLQSGNRVTSLHKLWRALRQGDSTTFAATLKEVLLQSASYFDGTEAFYHGFMTCLLLGLDENYKVLSNREAGLGRADILLQPRFDKSLPGFVFEFKESKKAEGLEQLAEAALQQIAERRYAAAFPPEIKEVRCYGLAFCRKECRLRQVTIST